MKTEHKNNIAAALKTRCTTQNLSYASLATMIPGKISPATISQIVNGKHDLISDEMWNRVAAFLNYKEDGITPMADEIKPGSCFDPVTKKVRWVIYQSDNFKVIQKRCTEAQEFSCFQAIDGNTGLGKTTGLSHYASQHENAFYVLCKNTMNAKEFINAILDALGISFEGTKYKCLQAAIDKLRSLNKALLILDDAGKVIKKFNGIIQEIYDGTEFYTGIAMAGTPEELKDYIYRAAARHAPGARQFKRRVNDWQSLNTPKHTIIANMAALYGITDEETVNLLCHYSRDYGTLRNIITNAARIANGTITVQNIMAVAERNTDTSKVTKKAA